MLSDDSNVLVYYRNSYYRGKYRSVNADKTVNVLLIDLGYTITVELANVSETTWTYFRSN